MPRVLDRGQFVEKLRERLESSSQGRHPLMELLHQGKLSKKQLQAWAVNRFYFQKSIPIKDAIILSKCPEIEVRRMWITRLLKREGLQRDMGDVDGWIAFSEAAGVKREALLSAKFLPGVRFAVDSYVNFARNSDWIDGVAASLTELSAKEELVGRISAFRKHYRWVGEAGLRFFISRLSQVDESNGMQLSIVMRYCQSRRAQEEAIAAAVFASEVTWSLNDSVFMNYVIRDRPLSDSL
jgi:pyrroloquinoline-quinone synthase